MAKSKKQVEEPVKRILISQPKPLSEKSPYYDLAKKYDLDLTFHQFIRVEGLTSREFKKQGIDLATPTAVIFVSRNAVDHFFRICDEIKYKISAETRYFCMTEAVALYLQKFILYRKRKVFFSADGSQDGLMDVLAKYKNKESFIMPVSEGTKNDMSPVLNKNGVVFSEAVMYRTVSNDLTPFAKQAYDMMLLFSPFGVDTILAEMPNVLKNAMKVGAFGITTCQAVMQAGLNLVIQAPAPKSPSMVAALEIFLKEKK